MWDITPISTFHRRKEDALAKPSYTVPGGIGFQCQKDRNCQKVATNCHYLSRILFPFYLSKGGYSKGKKLWGKNHGFGRRVSQENQCMTQSIRWLRVSTRSLEILGREGATNWVSPHDSNVGSTIINSGIGNQAGLENPRFSLMIFPLTCHLDLPVGHDQWGL